MKISVRTWVLVLPIAVCGGVVFGWWQWSAELATSVTQQPRESEVTRPDIEATETNEAMSAEVACDYTALERQVATIIAAVDELGDDWPSVVGESVEKPLPYIVDPNATERLLMPCAYEVTFARTLHNESERSAQFDPHLADRLVDHLRAAGWSDEVIQVVGHGGGSDASAAPTITLAHADGPNSSDHIFFRLSDDDTTGQFARVMQFDGGEYWPEYRRDERDSPCPCDDKVILSISRQFPIEQPTN